MPRDQSENPSNEESTSTLKKIANNLYYVFCGSEELDPAVNKFLIFNTYMQIAEILHIIILYTWFNKTNNFQYDFIQSVFSGLSFSISLIPRVNDKHYGLLLTFIGFFLITFATAASSAILIINYYTFTNYCTILSKYSQSTPTFTFNAESVCTTVLNLFLINFGADGVLTILRILYLYLNAQAYKVVKHKFDQEEKKKRRSQKFDEKEKNKTPYDPNRKI